MRGAALVSFAVAGCNGAESPADREEQSLPVLNDPVPEIPVQSPPEPVDQGPKIAKPSPEDILSVPEESPILGRWSEVARIPCDGGAEFVPDDPIEEFIVWRATFRLTRHPFETHVDYHAAFRLDERNMMTIVELGGYSIPDDIDRVGHFDIESSIWRDPVEHTKTEHKVLFLRDMWLGSSSGTEGEPSCGHRFVPQHVYEEMLRAQALLEIRSK